MDLIIDGNAFINVAISVTKAQTSRDKRSLDAYWVNDLFNDGGFILKDNVRTAFRNFCFTYLNSLIAPIASHPEKVHIVFDSKSWRKEWTENFFKIGAYSTTSAPTEFKYKGNRKYDEHQYLFFDYFQQVLMPALSEKAGINQYRFKDTEGDDIIAYLCENLDTDILIYSVDQDLKQLTGNKDKNVLLITPKQMAKTKRLFVPENLVPTIADDEVDNFFSLNDAHISGATIEKTISNLVSKDFVEHKVDFIPETLSKIFLGDKSDNIPKITGITPVKSTKLITQLTEKFGESLMSELDDISDSILNELVEGIQTLNKIKDQDKLNEIRDNIILNIRLIRLSTKVFPEEILNAIEAEFKNTQLSQFNYREFLNLKNNQTSL
jgi:5'-3' exonuclease